MKIIKSYSLMKIGLFFLFFNSIIIIAKDRIAPVQIKQENKYCVRNFKQVDLEDFLQKPIKIPISDGLSFIIPNGWEIAGDEVIGEMTKLKNSKNIPSSSLKYLLSPINENNIFGYPFISIGYEHLGINLLDNLSFDEWVKVTSKAVKKDAPIILNNSIPEFFDEIKFDEVIVDKAKNQIIFKAITGIPNVGEVISYLCLKCTNKGIVRVSLNTTKEEEQKSIPAFKIILKTL